MKKILSLVLVCLMTISLLTLTSCQDTYKTVESFVKEQLEDWGFVTRYTITKDEWDANWHAKNFTLVMTRYGESQEFLKTETKVKGYLGDQLMYFDIIDGVGYMILEMEGKWYAAEYGKPIWTDSTLLDSLDGDCYEIYDELVYNEDTQAYTWSDEELTAELKFVNGVLIVAKFTDINTGETLTVSNVGTTEIDIPEYEIYDYTIHGEIGS